MIQFILECISFQLMFLIIYDIFLKRETFFQWNRAYLIGTYILSMVLPWIKIEALKSSVPEQYYINPEFLWEGSDALVIGATTEISGIVLTWENGILYVGMFLAALYFGYKLYQIQRLRNNGSIQYYPNFTQIVIKNSELAFSFFRSIFLGDKVLQREHKGIIQHELVHIEQRHTWDLLFFELMRIIGWFNPLVYVYQSRVSELHEFIADAQVAKTHKKDQYELLLSEIFQTENISFINQFFNSSLLKKRIAMLQKIKSKPMFKFKYVLLLPIIFGMLFYTSCELKNQEHLEAEVSIEVTDINHLNIKEGLEILNELSKFPTREEGWRLKITDQTSNIRFVKSDDSYVEGPDGSIIKAKMYVDSKVLDKDFNLFEQTKEADKILAQENFPFAIVEEVPVFPGCEDAIDKRACFNENMQRHISKNFNYPQKAQEIGIQGRVAVMFTINEEGNIENIKMRGPDKSLEDEAARIISKLPRMEPGRHHGENVAVPFSIPITFRLQNQPDGVQFINEEGEMLDEAQKLTAKRYNVLLNERQRLLKNSNESNPIIINLDQQLKALRSTINKNKN